MTIPFPRIPGPEQLPNPGFLHELGGPFHTGQLPERQLPWAVTAYGADPNGVLDATTAITNCLTDHNRAYFPAGTYLANNLTVPADDCALFSYDGATIKKNANGPLLTVSGKARVSVVGLTLDGNQAGGFNNRCVFVAASADDFTIERCRLLNANTIGLEIDDSDRARVLDCHFEGCQTITLFGENDANDCLVRGCRVIGSGNSHAVAFHSTTSAKNAARLRIVDNEISATAGFCIEVGAFGGERPTDVVVSGNTLRSAGNNSGGVSLDSCDRSAVSGNTYDVDGNTVTYGLEFVVCTQVACSGNSINGETTLTRGISVNRTSESSFTGNTIDGVTTSGIGIDLLVSSATSPNCSDNVVSSNVVMFPASAASTQGVSLVPNNASAVMERNAVIGNVINGTGSIGATTRGINAVVGAGTLSRTTVVGNIIRSQNLGIRTHGDTNSLLGMNQFENCTNNYGGTTGAGRTRAEPLAGWDNFVSSSKWETGA